VACYETVHDFIGFPSALYHVSYPAPGQPELAAEIVQRLTEAAWPARLNRARGSDHGAWVVLRLMYPAAEIPVVALSINAAWSPEQQYALGKELEWLRARDVLVIGSGVTVHNFSELGPDDGREESWAVAFDEWLADQAARGEVAALCQYRDRAPHAERAVPPESPEHLAPFFYALGAAASAPRGQLLFRQYRNRTLSHTVWQFGEPEMTPLVDS
jgi:4,5-DOPA dioxygenase extradiol